MTLNEKLINRLYNLSHIRSLNWFNNLEKEKQFKIIYDNLDLIEKNILYGYKHYGYSYFHYPNLFKALKDDCYEYLYILIENFEFEFLFVHMVDLF